MTKMSTLKKVVHRQRRWLLGLPAAMIKDMGLESGEELELVYDTQTKQIILKKEGI